MHDLSIYGWYNSLARRFHIRNLNTDPQLVVNSDLSSYLSGFIDRYSEEMLNRYQKWAMIIHSWLYSFLYEFPLVWVNGFREISFQPKRAAKIGFLLNFCSAVVLLFACAYDLLSSYVTSRPVYNIGIASLHVMCSIFMLGTVSFIFCVIRNNECILAANAFIREPLTTKDARKSLRSIEYFHFHSGFTLILLI